MYLVLFAENGERITSLLLGIHGDTMQDLYERAKEFSYATLLETDNYGQEKTYTHNYINGEWVEKPVYKPTLDMLKKEAQQLVIERNKIKIDHLTQAINRTIALGNDATTAQEALKKAIEAQRLELLAIHQAKTEEELLGFKFY